MDCEQYLYEKKKDAKKGHPLSSVDDDIYGQYICGCPFFITITEVAELIDGTFV